MRMREVIEAFSLQSSVLVDENEKVVQAIRMWLPYERSCRKLVNTFLWDGRLLG